MVTVQTLQQYVEFERKWAASTAAAAVITVDWGLRQGVTVGGAITKSFFFYKHAFNFFLFLPGHAPFLVAFSLGLRCYNRFPDIMLCVEGPRCSRAGGIPKHSAPFATWHEKGTRVALIMSFEINRVFVC